MNMSPASLCVCLFVQDSASGPVHQVWPGHRLLLLSHSDGLDGALLPHLLPHLPPARPDPRQGTRHLLQEGG